MPQTINLLVLLALLMVACLNFALANDNDVDDDEASLLENQEKKEMTIIMVIVFFCGTSWFLFVIFAIHQYKKNRAKRARVVSLISKSGESTIKNTIGAKIDEFLQTLFYRWGTLCAKYPWRVLGLTILCAVPFYGGINASRSTTDPIELWSSSTSRVRVEKEFFDSHFGPFYRIERIIISPIGLSKKVDSLDRIYGPVFDGDFLRKIHELQESIKNLITPNHTKLDDICYRAGPPINGCVVQSIWNYWYNDVEILDGEGYLSEFLDCTEDLNESFGPYGRMMDPKFVLGGRSLSDANAIILTYFVNNYLEQDSLNRVKEWEATFIDFMKAWKKQASNMDVAFISERSFEDDLESSFKPNILNMIMSYIAMIIYLTFVLGRVRSWSRLMIDSKFTLAFAGVAIMTMSVGLSIGLFDIFRSICGGLVSAWTIFEIVPFLVLVCGINNVSILNDTYQRKEKKPNESIPQHIGEILSQVGPSMLLTSVLESICCFLGMQSNAPAVKTYALYAGLALLSNFILQITGFVSILALDAERTSSNRWDIFCWRKGTANITEDENKSGWLFETSQMTYVPIILNKWARMGVIIFFFGLLCTSITLGAKIEVGALQNLALPNDSYVTNFMTSARSNLAVGSPVYYVFKNVNLKHPEKTTIEQTACEILTGNANACELETKSLNSNFMTRTRDDASYIMSSYPITRKRDWEFLRTARENAKTIMEILQTKHNLKIQVFSYSVDDVLHEQYLTIWPDTFRSIGITLALIFIVTFFMMGLKFRSSIAVIITLAIILINVIGFMYCWNVPLNAVSLVNLIMSVGISMEFCSPLAYTYSISVQRHKIGRVREAAVSMGSSIFSGIIVTKYVGIIILAYSKSPLASAITFKIYMLTFVIAPLYSLFFLPVLLSYIGSPTNPVKLAKNRETTIPNDSEMHTTSTSVAS